MVESYEDCVVFNNDRYYAGSVSYTHLDVYKRQGFTSVIPHVEQQERESVSYTHLDVYKRQG